MSTEAEDFMTNSVGVLETSHDFNKYVFRAYSRVASVLLVITGGFIFIFGDGSQIKADSYGFMVL